MPRVHTLITVAFEPAHRASLRREYPDVGGLAGEIASRSISRHKRYPLPVRGESGKVAVVGRRFAEKRLRQASPSIVDRDGVKRNRIQTDGPGCGCISGEYERLAVRAPGRERPPRTQDPRPREARGFLSEVGDILRFRSLRAMLAYLGGGADGALQCRHHTRRPAQPPQSLPGPYAVHAGRVPPRGLLAGAGTVLRWAHRPQGPWSCPHRGATEGLRHDAEDAAIEHALPMEGGAALSEQAQGLGEGSWPGGRVENSRLTGITVVLGEWHSPAGERSCLRRPAWHGACGLSASPAHSTAYRFRKHVVLCLIFFNITLAGRPRVSIPYLLDRIGRI